MKPNALRAWRKRRGWTQAEAAKAIGISHRQYQAYEGGTAVIPKPVRLACVALALGETDFRDAFGGDAEGEERDHV